MARRPPKPPDLIASTIVLRRDGKDQRVNLVDVVIERVRTGAPRELAAESVGLNRSTLVVWNRRGIAARDLREADKPIPPAELPYLDFSDRLAQADAEASLTDWTRLGIIAHGGVPHVVTREVYDAKGNLVTKHTTKDVTQPNERALMFRLRVRHKELFGDTLTVEGDDEHPLNMNVQMVVANLTQRLRDVQEQARGNVIEMPAASTEEATRNNDAKRNGSSG